MTLRNFPIPNFMKRKKWYDAVMRDSNKQDSFGIDRISQRYGLLENKFSSQDNELQWQIRLWGCIINYTNVAGPGYQVGDIIRGITSGMKGTITEIGIGYLVFKNTVDYAANGGGTVGYTNKWVLNEQITNDATPTATTSNIINFDSGAHYYWDYDSASSKISVGTKSGQRAVLQSMDYPAYIPGYGHNILMTKTLSPAQNNLVQIAMYGDDLNGGGVMLDGFDLKVFIRSNANSSAEVRMDYVLQSDWDDPLDGTGPSGIILNPVYSQIDNFSFEWLGVGRFRCSVDIDGILIPFFTFKHANLTSGVYMRTTNGPIRYEIYNKADTILPATMDAICQSISSEGGHLQVGSEFTLGLRIATKRTIASGAIRPVYLVKLNNFWPTGKPNRRRLIFLTGYFGSIGGDADGIFYHIHDLKFLTSASGWQDLDASSNIQYCDDATAIDAQHFHQIGIVPNVAGQQGEVIPFTGKDVITNHSTLHQNFESDNSQIFGWFAESIGPSCDIICGLTVLDSD